MSPVLSAVIGLGSLSAGLLGWSFFGFLSGSPQLKPSNLSSRVSFKNLNTRVKIFLAGLALCLLMAIEGGLYGGLLSLIIFVSGFLVLPQIPNWKKKVEKDKRLRGMREVFPQTLGITLQALKTGQTLPQVIEYLSLESPQPLRDEWSLVCAEMSLGSSTEQALSKMGNSYQEFQEFHQFLESYKISRSTGANLTQLVQVLMEGMEEKSRIWRKMEAMTAQARLSGLLVGLLPLLLGFVFFLMDPGLITPLFTEKLGWAILLLAAFLESIGFLWIRQTLQLEV